MDQQESEILAILQRRAQGAYDRAKQADTNQGGRQLPKGLKNAVTQITNAKLDKTEKKGDPYVFFYSSVVEPVEHAKTFAGFMFGLYEDEYNTFEDNFNKFVGALRLIGYDEHLQKCTEQQFWTTVLPFILQDLKQRKPYILFDTSSRASGKNEEYKPIIRGVVAPGYTPPQSQQTNLHQGQGYQPFVPNAGPSLPPGVTGQGVPGTAAPSGPPIKAPPSQKGPPIKGPPVQPQVVLPVQMGQKAMTINNAFKDGETWRGEISGVDTAKRTVLLRIGTDDYEVPFANIAPDDGKTGLPQIGPGSRVENTPDYFGDGNKYPGTVLSVNGNAAQVDFGNNQIADIPLDKLTLAA